MPHQCTNCGRTFPDGSKEMLSGCSSCGGNKFQFKPTIDDDDQTSDAGRDDSTGQSGGSAQHGSSSRSPDPPPTKAGGDSPPAPSSQSTRSETDASSSRDRTGKGGVTGTVADAADTVRDWVGSEDTGSNDGRDEWHTKEPKSGRDRTSNEATEDTAQADARSGVVDPDAIPASTTEIDETTPATDSNETTPATEIDETTPATDVTFDDPESTQAGPDTTDVGGAETTPPSDDETPDLEMLREELNQQFESIRIIAPGQYELNLMELYDREEYIISLLEDGRYAIEVPEAWRDSAE